MLVSAGAVAGVGLALLLLAADLIPKRYLAANVPDWILAGLGVALVLAGASVFFRTGSPLAARLVGISMLLLGLAFAWAAVLGDRLALGACAALFLWLGASALKHARLQPEAGAGEAGKTPP